MTVPTLMVSPRRSARSVRHYVEHELRAAIITGRLSPGERLGQERLCAEFNVSPGPLREALRQLESEGLVAHVPNRGAFVIDVPADELVHVLIPLRLVLEQFAVAEALPRLRDEDWQQLDSQIELMREAVGARDLVALTEADVRFHEILVLASGKQHTIQLWRSILPRIRGQFYLTRPDRRLHAIIEEHRTLLAALRAGRVREIRAALREHIASAAKLIPADGARPR